ncbi:MAG: MBOAT family protein [Proteobacteria bacterium]|nr:MBOAT family protein [Pseudomonadota bacterium]
MQFDSLTFLVFFAIVLVAFWTLQGWGARKNLLLAASYIFYAAWNPLYVGLILLSTLVDWLVAGRMLLTRSVSQRRLLLLISLVVNLGLLAWFKYTNFLLDVSGDLLATFGLTYQPPAYDIVLPVGISFYTFQTLSYTIDIYRGKLERHWSLRDFALFVSFFPQLVAGPIVRAAHFLPQTERPAIFSRDALGMGLALVACGLFMKVVLADAFVAPVADAVFAESGRVGFFGAWIGTLSFGAQIFFDFAGYSTIAIGTAACLGFVILDNFQKPYGAQGFSDFWSRWHISLSTWFRDYLYIPLGGNRGTTWATYRNLMLTMLIAGFWHGASWMFLIWGFVHGAMLMLERAAGLHAVVMPPIARAIYAFFVLVMVHVAWVFFRSSDMTAALEMLDAMTGAAGDIPRTGHEPFAVLVIVGMLVYQITFRDARLQDTLLAMKPLFRGVLLGILLLLVFLYSGGDERSFIYFQF